MSPRKSAQRKPRPKYHGLSRYTNNGCRCPDCRDAMAAYMREYRKRNKVAA